MIPRLSRLVSAPLLVGVFLGAAASGFAAGMLGSSVFSDVQPGSYYDAAIGEMYDAGIIKGYDDGRFGPNDTVTRGQIAVMLARFRDSLGDTVAVSEEEESSRSSSSSSSSSSSVSSSSSSSSAASIGPEGTIRFTIKSFTVSETVGTATVSVVRTNGNAGSVTVSFATADGTAKAGTDYTQTTGTLQFANRETSRTFTIPISDDTLTEGNEDLGITLSNVTGGATLSTPTTTTLTIVDNETSGSSAAGASTSSAHAIMFNANTYAVQENGTTIVITVRREGGTAPVSVNYSATNGTAIAQDYTLQSGTLSFAQGELTKSFSVIVADDSVVDGNKTVNLYLTAPTGGAVLGNPALSVLTLVDNETTPTATGSLKLSSATVTAAEGESALVTVTRAGGNAGTVSVTYTTSNATAIAGLDYVGVTGTLTFLPGETSRSFLVPITKDTIEGEGEEMINISIASPTGGAGLLSPTTGTIRISG